MRRLVCILLSAAAVLAFGVGMALADTERILEFDSLIRVHKDTSLTVTETITVQALGRQIKRGIVREFPTTYRDRTGRRVVVRFEVLKVLRDGVEETYHLEDASNGKKVYIGQKSVFLRPGVYTYTLTYRTDRQLGYFKKYDELYWNATGNNWRLPIDLATATVELPRGAEVLRQTAYTGRTGESGRDFFVRRDNAGRPLFTTTRTLDTGEGLTIAVAWPKGLVDEPQGLAKVVYFLSDYPGTMGSGAGFLFLLLYYLFAWFKVGRDPKPGVIVPRFLPPRGLSAPAMRYVRRMGFDNTCFAAAVVNMAVKGYIKVKEGAKYFTLQKTGADWDVLTLGEKKLANHLFPSKNSIILQQANHRKIQGALGALKRYLQKEFAAANFRTNLWWGMGGLGLTLVCMAGMVLTSADIMGTLFMSIWLMGWSIGVFFLIWRWWWAKGLGQKIFTSLFVLPFLGGEAAGIWALSQSASLPAVVLFVLAAILNPIFFWLLKAPTKAGRELLDEIEGFEMYLGAAEQDRLEALHPPERTPELFEKYLPYALALGVEQGWSEQFASKLAHAGSGGGQYAPTWYSGVSWASLGAAGFASELSTSMSGAIGSASTSPGSSSGSGGGGSSGGGGGGGGGGGW